MKTLINYTLLLFLSIYVVGCGTGEYLGFEKKKIPLKGDRISVLKDISIEKKENLSSSKIELSNPIELSSWRQSFNSPTHYSLNLKTDSQFKKFKKITKGVGENNEAKILSQPLINKNILFFLDATSTIIAHDLEKKKLIWKRNLVLQNDKGHSIGGGIVVDENFLYVGSPYAEILCIDLKNGDIIWKQNTVTPIRSTPTLIKNKIIVLTLDNRTIAFDKVNGSLVWEHQGIQSTTSIIGQPKIAVDGNLVLSPYSNGEIFALNLTNGKEIWKQSSLNIEKSETSNSFTDIDANPVILKNTVIVASTTGKIFSLNKKNGNQVWEQYLNTTQTPLINGNSIFVLHNNKEVVNLDLRNGKIRWIYEIEKSFLKENNLWLSPVMINNKLIVVGGEKKMIVIDPNIGVLEKNYNLPGIPISPPVVVNKKVFIMFQNSAIYYIE